MRDVALFDLMVVEDNPADVVLLRYALTAEGLEYEMRVLSDGEVACRYIDRLDAEPELPCPSLLLLDLNLPRRSGAEVLARVRQSRRCADLPVVVMSSSDAPQDRAAVQRLGASAYFRKPCSLDGFLRVGGLCRQVLGVQ